MFKKIHSYTIHIQSNAQYVTSDKLEIIATSNVVKREGSEWRHVIN